MTRAGEVLSDAGSDMRSLLRHVRETVRRVILDCNKRCLICDKPLEYRVCAASRPLYRGPR
jgi:hypothetical protein